MAYAFIYFEEINLPIFICYNIANKWKVGATMKTFKMLSFQLPEGEEWRPYPIEDGLLINQENSHNTWILEAFLPASERPVFDELLASGEVFDARAVISFPDNDPVLFRLVVTTVKEINAHVSILMKGTLVRKKRKNPVDVLRGLAAEGNVDTAAVEELLEKFEDALAKK